MRFARFFFLAPLLSFLLAGCAHYAWVKPGGDPATFPADNYACKQESLAAAPPAYQTYAPMVGGPPDIVRTRCFHNGPYEECRTYAVGHPYPPPPTTYDLNQGARGDMYSACMNAHGWFYQAVEPVK